MVYNNNLLIGMNTKHEDLNKYIMQFKQDNENFAKFIENIEPDKQKPYIELIGSISQIQYNILKHIDKTRENVGRVVDDYFEKKKKRTSDKFEEYRLLIEKVDGKMFYLSNTASEEIKKTMGIIKNDIDIFFQKHTNDNNLRDFLKIYVKPENTDIDNFGISHEIIKKIKLSSNEEIFNVYLPMYYKEDEDRATIVKDLLVSILGAVNVVVKLRTDNVNEYITIDDDNIILSKGADEKPEKIKKQCYNYVSPQNYDAGYKNDNISENVKIYNSVSDIIESCKDGNRIFIFGSGYSGSGKTYTLLNAKDSILKQIINQHKRDILGIYAFEQYGYLILNDNDFDSNQNPRDIQRIPNVFNNLLFGENINKFHYGTKELEITNYDKNNINGIITNNNDNLYNREKNIDNILEDIENLRMKNKSIKATVNNPESSRSHLYIVLSINKGYVILVDMAGQENSKEILRDYLGNSEILKAYIHLLFARSQYTGEIANHKITRTQVQVLVNKFIKMLPKDVQYNMNSVIPKETKDEQIRIPFITRWWMYITFYYPHLLFLGMKAIIESKATIQSICPKTIDFNKFSEETSLPQCMNSVGIPVTVVNEFTTVKNTIAKFKGTLIGKLSDIKGNMQDEKAINKFNLILQNVTFESLIETFLEGFYINETIVSKIRYFKELQYIRDEKPKYIPIIYDKFDPFISYGNDIDNITNMTQSIFKQIIGENTPKFIEIACIRGDKGDDTNLFKYANASCLTLKTSAMLSGAQCDTKNMCNQQIQKGGYNNDKYYYKYMKYKQKYLQSMLQ